MSEQSANTPQPAGRSNLQMGLAAAGLAVLVLILLVLLGRGTSTDGAGVTTGKKTGAPPGGRTVRREEANPPPQNIPLKQPLDPVGDALFRDLLDNHWDREAATAVVELNRDWFQLLTKVAPGAAGVQRRALTGLGQSMEQLAHFLRERPETAGLLANLPPEHRHAVAATLRHEPADYPLVAGLFLQHAARTEAAALADVLRDDHGRVCRLIRRGLLGAQIAFLDLGNHPGDRVYRQWLREQFDLKLGAGDDELASFFQFVLDQGPGLRQQLNERPKFATQFPGTLWPKLVRASRAHGQMFECYLDEPGIWPLLQLNHGEELLREHGMLPARLLFGEQAYPETLHPLIIAALANQDAVLVELLADLQGERGFTVLLERPLDQNSLRAACARLQALSVPEERRKLLRRFGTFTDDALRREVGPPPAGIVTWVPGHAVVLVVGKFYDGRDVTTLDWFDAVIDVGSGLLPAGKGVKVVLEGGKGLGKAGVNKGLSEALRSQGLTLLRKKLGAQVAEQVARKTTDRGLARWSANQMIAGVQKVVREQLPKLVAIDITKPVQLAFTMGRRVGLQRDTFRWLTRLEARLFMRQDARVVLYLGPRELAEAAQLVLRFLNQRGAAEAQGFVAAPEPAGPPPRAGLPAFARDEDDWRWRQQAAAWWLLHLNRGLPDRDLADLLELQ